MYAETIFKYEESLLSHRISSIERIISKQKESITHPSLLHQCSSYKISISLRELVNQIVNHRGRENAPQHGEGAGAGGGPGMPPPPPRGAQGSMAVCTLFHYSLSNSYIFGISDLLVRGWEATFRYSIHLHTISNTSYLEPVYRKYPYSRIALGNACYDSTK